MNRVQILKTMKYALRFLPDKMYIQLYYFARFRRFCNLKNPTTYNEKLNWLKLYDRNPEYTRLVDKYEVKKYVASLIGEDYIIPTLGVWNRFEDIDFEGLPSQFVLKCTHDSAGLVIVKDKSKMDMEAVKKKIETAFKQNFYYVGREWPYKNVKPRIIAEQYMEDKIDKELRDYKFFCFDGEPKAMFIASARDTGHPTKDYYDMDFKHLEVKNHYPTSKKEVRKPVTFDEMKKVAGELSKGFTHVRVDFYEVDGRLYFGELTFYPCSGFGVFEPDEWDTVFGNWMKLPSRS